MVANKLLNISKKLIDRYDYDISQIDIVYNEEIRNFLSSNNIDNDKLSILIDFISPCVNKEYFLSYIYLLILSFKVDSISNNEILANFWYLFAKSSMKINAASNAKKAAHLALKLYKKNTFVTANVVFCNAIIATSSRNLGDYPTAIKYYLKAKSISNDIKFYALENWQIFRLGKMYLNYLNQPSRGVDYITQALDNFYNIGNKSSQLGAAACLDELGDVHRQSTKNIDIAKEYYNKALELNKSINNKQGEVRNIAHLGLVEERLLNFSLAKHYLEKAVNDIRKIDGEQRGLGLRLGQLAGIYLRFDNIELAKINLKEAVKLSKRYNDHVAIIKHEICWGVLHRKSNNFDRAQKSYNNAKEICDKFKQYDLLVKVYDDLFSMYFNELEEYDKAKEMILKRFETKGISCKSIYQNNPHIEEVENKHEIGSMYKSLYEKVLEDSQYEFKKMINSIHQAYNLAFKESEEKVFNIRRLFQAGALMAGVNHDVHNLLNDIVSNINSILRCYNNDLSIELKDKLKIIKEISLIGCDTLSASVTQSILSTTPYEKEFKSLKSVLRPILIKINENCTKKSINLILSQKIPDLYIKCDSTIFNMILLNIVQNSIDAMFKSKNKVLNLYFSDNLKGKILIIISDTGIGLKKEEIIKIFNVGFSRKSGHLGLGLPTVKFLVESIGGNIGVNSTIEKGTSFNIEIPAKKEK